ncbi:hypothetical protein M407DRAFT_33252 [Tulasnella calospora MUT 4182]|uniref:HSF-type DNA-binding domain-containing protein n=1 Tax=Tulasnella calospora MUT 4182 TaxID=1051891 RepID=A0A0C3K6S5_9AGAM|nr:hypothetical protein M407DRAFT_33252 [Tulasnella calospora MUT 4182]
MSPQHALRVLSFSRTQSPNPSASHTPFSRLDLQSSARCMLGAQSLREVDDAQYSLQNTPDAPHCAMEGESTAQNANVLLNNIRLYHHCEQKQPSGKPFPFKVYDMLEDKPMMPYVRWIKSGDRDAFLIPNIEAFIVNVIPKHFKEMNQWASFQKQLNNYGFEKQDRGAGKALYAHLENKFRKGRPDLLPEVLRRPHWPTKACKRQVLRPARRRPPTPIAPTAPQPESQIYPDSREIQLESRKALEMKILELGRELKNSTTTQSTMENRLQATEDRLLNTEDRLWQVEHQLLELLKRLEGTPVGAGTSGLNVHMVTVRPVQDYDVPHDGAGVAAIEVTVRPDASPTGSPLQSVSFESHLTKEPAPGVFYDAVEAGIGAIKSLAAGPSQSVSPGSHPTTESTLSVLLHPPAACLAGLHTELSFAGSIHSLSSESYLSTEMASAPSTSQLQGVFPEYHLVTGPACNPVPLLFQTCTGPAPPPGQFPYSL